MAGLVICALAVLFAAGCYLLAKEWRRFRLDRAPAPPPEPEEAAVDRWYAGMVMLVAGLSIAGAIIAFWASSEFTSASDAGQQALQEGTQYQTVLSQQDSYLNFGANLAQTYQQHTVAESSLYSEAAAAWQAGQTSQALALEAQARVEGAQERLLVTGFTCYWPYAPGLEGQVNYDLSQLRASEVESPCVQPDQDPSALRTLDEGHQKALESTAASDRSRAEAVVLAGALVIAAVFFLTVSYLGWRHRRAHSLAPGVAAIGMALAVAVGVALT